MLSPHRGSIFVTSSPWCGCIAVLPSHHYAIGACFRRIFKTVLGCFILEKGKVDLWFFPSSTSVVRDTNTNHYKKKKKRRVYFTLLSSSKKLSFLFSFVKEQHFFLLSSSLNLVLNFFSVSTLPLWIYQPSNRHFYWTLEWDLCLRVTSKYCLQG